MFKRGMWETLAPWIIAIGLLFLMLFIYGLINGSFGEIGENIMNTLRFGR